MSSLGALAGHRIVPVIVIDDAARGVDLAHALKAGGIHCAEITLRTPAGLEAIRAMARVPDFTVGAGTVIRPAEAFAVAEAGAVFAVSPGLDPLLVDAVRAAGMGVLPGVATASEVQLAVREGLEAVKFFPADRLGGLGTIRALAAPFAGLGFVPSGGVTASSALDYLADPAVPAVSGSWMASRAAIAAGDWDEITRLSLATTAAIASL